MLDFLFALKAVTTTVSAIRAADTVQSWLSKEPRLPLARALDETAERFDTEFPNIKDSLVKLLDNPDFATRVEAMLLSPSPISLSEIAPECVRLSGFYLPVQAEAYDAMERVLANFLENFDRAKLSADDGVAWLDRKQNTRQTQLMTAIETASQASGFRSAIVETKRAARGASYQTARELWRLQERTVEQVGGIGPDLLFELHSCIGNLALEHGRFDEAADYFLRAHNAAPTHARAAIHLAMSLMIRGDRANALLQIASESDPSKRRFFEAQIHYWFDDAKTAYELLLPELQRSASADELGLLTATAIHVRDLATAESAARRMVQLFPSQGASYLALGGVLVELARGASRGHSRSVAEAAWQHADDALASAIRFGCGGRESEALTTRASIAMVLEKPKDALELAEAAMRIEDSDDSTLMVVEIALTQGFDRTSLLEDMIGRHQERALELALRAARVLKQPASRQSSLLQTVRSHWPHIPYRVWSASLDLAITGADDATIDSLLQAAPTEGGGKVKLIRARVAIRRNDRESARHLLEEAAVEIDPARDPAMLEVAGALLQLGAYSEATAAYERFGVSLADPDEVLRCYCLALAKTDKGDDRVLELMALTSTDQAPLPVIESAVRICDVRGDIVKMESLLLSLHDRFPKNASYSLGLAVAKYRTGDRQAALSLLPDIPIADLQGSDVFLMAELHRLLGDGQMSLRTAFEAWRRAPEDPEVSSHFAGAALRIRSSEEDAPAPLCIAERTVAILDIAGDERTVLVANEDVLPAFCGVLRYAPDSEMGRVLLGKTVGSSATWSHRLGGTTTAVVKEILVPELFALRIALDQASFGNPGGESIRKVKVTDDLLTGELVEIVKQGRARADGVAEQIASQPTPMATIARLLNVSTFEAWQMLTKGFNGGVFSNENTVEEQQRERASTKTLSEALLDPTALLTLATTDASRVVDGWLQPCVVQATIDSLAHELDKLAPHRKDGILHLTFVAGQAMPRLSDPTEVQSEYRLLEQALEFARKARLVALHRGLTDKDEEMLPVVGEEFVHSLIASELLPLWSDDVVLRAHAQASGSPGTISTVGILGAALERGRIDAREQALLILKLTRLNYRQLCVTAGMLNTSVENQFALADHQLLLRGLVREGVNPKSVGVVVWLHFQEVCRSAVVWEVVEPYLRACIETVRETIGLSKVAAIVDSVIEASIVVPVSALRLQALVRSFLHRSG